MAHMQTNALIQDRRDSLRVMTRLYVRGLGDDRFWSDRLGNLSLGGVGFEFPRAPEAERFQVAFSIPGDPRVRRATAALVDYDPLEGTLDRDHPFFVRLKFHRIRGEDEVAIAESLEDLAILPRLGYAGRDAAAAPSPRSHTASRLFRFLWN